MKNSLLIIVSILALYLSGAAQAVQVPGPLVDTNWLAKHAGEVTILDVRKDVKSFTAKPRFSKDKKTGKLALKKVGGHIPGAALVNYKKVRVDRVVDGKKLQKNIPDKADFEALMQEAGLNKGATVVIVSKGESHSDMTIATRLYWQLKYFGQDNMAILNGGVAQWLKEQRKISLEADKPMKGSWVASAERKEILASTADVQKALKDGTQLLDSRDMAQYLGTYHKSYVYAPGHLPGAKVFPNATLTAPSAPATFWETDKLKSLSAALGIKTDAPTINYCNSGHLASGAWFVMSELMGNKNAKLYDGSMHEWTLDKNRPVTAMKVE